MVTLLNWVFLSQLWLNSAIVRRIKKLMKKAETSTGEQSDMFEAHYRSAVLEAKIRQGNCCWRFLSTTVRLALTGAVVVLECMIAMEMKVEQNTLIVIGSIVVTILFITFTRAGM